MSSEKKLKFLVHYYDLDCSFSFSETQIVELTRQHVENIKRIDLSGHLFFCGLYRGENQAVLILKAANYEEAESLIICDPFIINKIYKYTITELEEANKENNYLFNEESN